MMASPRWSGQNLAYQMIVFVAQGMEKQVVSNAFFTVRLTPVFQVSGPRQPLSARSVPSASMHCAPLRSFIHTRPLVRHPHEHLAQLTSSALFVRRSVCSRQTVGDLVVTSSTSNALNTCSGPNAPCAVWSSSNVPSPPHTLPHHYPCCAWVTHKLQSSPLTPAL